MTHNRMPAQTLVRFKAKGDKVTVWIRFPEGDVQPFEFGPYPSGRFVLILTMDSCVKPYGMTIVGADMLGSGRAIIQLTFEGTSSDTTQLYSLRGMGDNTPKAHIWLEDVPLASVDLTMRDVASAAHRAYAFSFRRERQGSDLARVGIDLTYAPPAALGALRDDLDGRYSDHRPQFLDGPLPEHLVMPPIEASRTDHA